MITASTQTRDNNLNLIRMFAALAVLISHAWPVALGHGTPEPLEEATGLTLGTMAVMVFFGLSGFLITASWCRWPRAMPFLARRLRRLLPGLWAALLLTALVLGPMVTTLQAGHYLADSGTWLFLARNALLLPVMPDLPGVFTANPYPAAAGPIWTLHYEVLCYAGVMLAGLAGAFAPGRARWWLAGYGLLYGLSLGPEAAGHLHPRLESLRDLSLPFVMGAALCHFRVGLHPVVLMVLITGAVFADGAAQKVLTAGALVYGALLAGFWPSRLARQYNRLGDYSYGVYIYAFPIQGLVQYLDAGLGPAGNILLALPATLVLAVVSWHLVEKPWLHGTAPAAVRMRTA